MANIWQSFFVLIAAVAIIGGIMLLIKKISQQRLQNKATVNLNVISKITLQPKNHLFVVKVADKILVLGVTDNSINILTELDSNFETDIDYISKQEIADTIIKKVTENSINTTHNKPTTDVSFMNFIKSSIGMK